MLPRLFPSLRIGPRVVSGPAPQYARAYMSSQKWSSPAEATAPVEGLKKPEPTSSEAITADSFKWLLRGADEGGDEPHQRGETLEPVEGASSPAALLAKVQRSHRDKAIFKKQLDREEKQDRSDAVADRPPRPQMKHTLTGDRLEGWRLRRSEQKIQLDGPWRPQKRLSRSTMEKMRFLNQNVPDTYDVSRLAQEFKVSFEVARRILKSRFQPTPETLERQAKVVRDKRTHVIHTISEERYIKEMQEKAKARQDARAMFYGSSSSSPSIHSPSSPSRPYSAPLSRSPSSFRSHTATQNYARQSEPRNQRYNQQDRPTGQAAYRSKPPSGSRPAPRPDRALRQDPSSRPESSSDGDIFGAAMKVTTRGTLQDPVKE